MGEVIPKGMGPEIEKQWHAFQAFKEDVARRWQKHANRRTLAIILAVVAPLVVLYVTVLRAPSDFPMGDIVTIDRNETASQVAQQFAHEHLVMSARALEFALRIMGDRNIHAGDYQFNHAKNVLRIAQALIMGDFGLEPVKIQIPAGSTIEDMAVIFAKRLPRFDPQVFVRDATPYEGYLYPDTYFFLPTAKADVVLLTLRETFGAKVATVKPEIDAFKKPPSEVIIMASILEREASDYTDRQMIAGILWKRIKIDMPLQVDATLFYALNKSTSQLTLEDLNFDSPYNTYKYKGLPPGPIASPSLNSIRAAVHPIDKGYLFYLADKGGITHYSATYEAHLRKKRYYLGP